MNSFYRKTEDNRAEDSSSIPIRICRPVDVDTVLAQLPEDQRAYAEAKEFSGAEGQLIIISASTGDVMLVLYGVGPADQDDLGPIRCGNLASRLKPNLYEFHSLPADWDESLAAIGWGLGAYKFDRYLKDKKTFPVVKIAHLDDADEIDNIIRAVHTGRDLINTPSNDMGPIALEGAARSLASEFSATVNVIEGEALIAENYPMIHAVGRAAHEAPRLVELNWGDDSHPRLAIAGKGITFDTGGVNIKSASGARIMKKDMGGAAHAIALAHMIMANNLPIRLHLLLAIAENAVSSGAYRPGDILPSRAGKTVEIDNTDAEGRLVLGDTLTRAGEDDPALIIDFATLTGAARVALGPNLPPFFTNRENLVAPVMRETTAAHDPVWNMPLWAPYMRYLSSPIADMKNAGGGFAGCITAALFLEQFVLGKPWMHFDVYGWNPSSRPGHPPGGEIFALRGLYNWLKSGGLEEV